MKKIVRLLLYLISFVFSFLSVFGLASLILRMLFGPDNNHDRGFLFFLGCTVFAALLTGIVIHPIIRSYYHHIMRKSKSSLSFSAHIKKHRKNLSGSSGAAVFMVRDDEELTVFNASAGFWHLIGSTSTSVRSNRSVSLASIIHEDDIKDVRDSFLENSITIPQIDFRIVTPDRGVVWCRLCGVKEEIGRSGMIVSNCVVIDITDFLYARNNLTLEKERYRLMLNSLSSAVWEYNVAADELFLMNRRSPDGKFQQIKDYRNSVVRSGDIHPDHIDTYFDLCDSLRSREETISAELRMKNSSGNYAWYKVSGKPILNDQKEIMMYIGQIERSDDIHDNNLSANLKDYDTLTHTYNRYAFESLVNAIIINGSSNPKGALFIINIDHFQRINSSLGRLFGDALLIELSEALRSMFPEGSVLSRVSGDEFAVFTDSYESEEKLFELAGTVCGCVKHCFISTDQREIVTCCVGIALYPAHGNTLEQLVYSADSALVYAKNRGDGNYCVYNSGIEQQLAESSTKHSHEIKKHVTPAHNIAIRDDSLLSQAVDILFESRELSSSINLIISLICRRFKLDRAYVLELSEGMTHATMTYNWHAESQKSISDDVTVLPIDSLNNYIYCTSKDEYFLCNSISEYIGDNPTVAPLIERYNVHAMLQCPILDGDRLLGCFTYVFCRDGDRFTDDSVREITLITKIIAGYLVRLRTRQDVDRITYMDKLTGIMNFNAFQLEFERLLERSSERSYAIVYSDIDRFKFINEKYGYRSGDKILCAIAGIYRSNLKNGEFFARITGDKFIALLHYSNSVELDSRISRIHEQINSIRKTDSGNYYLPVRSGVYLVEPDDNSISSMIDRANLARKAVKNIHINTIYYFNENRKSRLKLQKDIEEVMVDALNNEEFVIYYQPKFSLDTNKIAGAEALVRWKRPSSSRLLRPDEFIPIFEDNGFVVELDFYVLDKVCRKLRRDIDSGMPVLPISVNFSRTHLNSDDLVRRLSSCLQKYRIPPNLVEIEITESALTENEGYLVDIIGELHDIGLIVSMDDFGSGFSSLNLLKKLPVDVLKIDKNFFAGDSATERERCIIENVMNMARSLGIHVVSEGVETNEQANFLRSIKCDLAQGYLFAPPLDEASFERSYQQH